MLIRPTCRLDFELAREAGNGNVVLWRIIWRNGQTLIRDVVMFRHRLSQQFPEIKTRWYSTPDEIVFGVEYQYNGVFNRGSGIERRAVLGINATGAAAGGSGIGFTPRLLNSGRHKTTVSVLAQSPDGRTTDGFQVELYTCESSSGCRNKQTFYTRALPYKKTWKRRYR